MCMLVADTSDTYSQTNYHLCGSAEHLFKLSVQFDAFNGYFVVNFKKVNLCLRAFSVIQISQGSVATLITSGGWYS